MKPEDLAGKPISVTQEDISTGVRLSAAQCPVTLAVKRCLSTDVVAIGVKWAHIRLPGEPVKADYPLPESVREFIRRFDHGESVEPFEFTLGPAQLPRPFPEEPK